MKKVLSFILCVVMTLCTVVGINIPVMAEDLTGNAEDTNELIRGENLAAGSSFGEATDISVNSVVTDNLESETDKNFYKFSVEADGYVSFSFSHQYVDSSSKKWSLVFYNIEQQRFFIESFYGNVLDSTVITTMNIGIPKGTYYLCIQPYSVYDYSSLLYNVRVNYTADFSWETEFNNTLPTSDFIQTNYYYHGTNMDSNDDDYYCFELYDDSYIDVLFSHQYVDVASKKWNITIYDGSGNKLISDSYYGNVLDTTVSKTCNIGLKKGKYYIRVSPYSVYDYAKVDYSFCVECTQTSDYETEWNDSVLDADLIRAGQTISGNQMSSGDVDYYYFENKKSGIVSIDFSHEYEEKTYNRWTMTFYDKDLKKLWSESFDANNFDTYSRRDWLESGKYYISISPYSSYDYTSIPYHLNVNYYDGQEIPSQTMYRLYFSGNGEHFYTTDEGERDYLISIGWDYEGEAWQAPLTSNTPVYRLFNPRTGEHHYTSDAHEKDVLSSQGWNYDGIGWYSDDFGGTAMIRLFNPNTNPAGSHHYTKDESEYNYLVNSGWIFEGVGWYGL